MTMIYADLTVGLPPLTGFFESFALSCEDVAFQLLIFKKRLKIFNENLRKENFYIDLPRYSNIPHPDV